MKNLLNYDWRLEFSSFLYHDPRCLDLGGTCSASGCTGLKQEPEKEPNYLIIMLGVFGGLFDLAVVIGVICCYYSRKRRIERKGRLAMSGDDSDSYEYYDSDDDQRWRAKGEVYLDEIDSE